MLRPDLAWRYFTYHRRASGISARVVDDVLAAYGLRIQGKAEVPGGPGRSQNLIVETNAGKKMLKQYKNTVDLAAVQHEHEILTYLAAIEFPAPRLTTTRDGDSLYKQDATYYAVFDVLEGYFQYHHYFFLPTQTRQFIAAAAQALGALHTALQDFTPAGTNQNGFTSRQGVRWRELDWFLDRLAACQAAIDRVPPRQSDPIRDMFLAHAPWVTERLATLDDVLGTAMLPRLIIHGDYGPYNLFFKRDAPVVILDFELARLDWRLTDLATALPSFARNRLGFNWNKLRWFLHAYQACCPVDTAELRLLPDVWLFLTLRRLVVCWQRYCDTAAQRWLVEAHQRLKLAQWIGANQQTFADQLTR